TYRILAHDAIIGDATLSASADNQIRFSEHDEGPHASSEHPLWQESVLLHWYDQRQGIGGWHRIGHEPNNSGGRVALWSFMFDQAGWQYRRCGDQALSGDDRLSNGFGAGSLLRFA